VAGSGAILRLGGNVSAAGTDLIGGSYGRKGIFIQLGSNFRELGNSVVDLLVEPAISTSKQIRSSRSPHRSSTVESARAAVAHSSSEPYQAGTFAGPITSSTAVCFRPREMEPSAQRGRRDDQCWRNGQTRQRLDLR
jgi:hypothetical protein